MTDVRDPTIGHCARQTRAIKRECLFVAARPARIVAGGPDRFCYGHLARPQAKHGTASIHPIPGDGWRALRRRQREQISGALEHTGSNMTTA